MNVTGGRVVAVEPLAEGHPIMEFVKAAFRPVPTWRVSSRSNHADGAKFENPPAFASQETAPTPPQSRHGLHRTWRRFRSRARLNGSRVKPAIPTPRILVIWDAGADRDRADTHIAVIDVPAFLAGFRIAPAGEFGHPLYKRALSELAIALWIGLGLGP